MSMSHYSYVKSSLSNNISFKKRVCVSPRARVCNNLCARPQACAPGRQPGRPHHAQWQLCRGHDAVRRGTGAAGGAGRVWEAGEGEGAGPGGNDQRRRRGGREAQEGL